jgi:hypothetical protein
MLNLIVFKKKRKKYTRQIIEDKDVIIKIEVGKFILEI